MLGKTPAFDIRNDFWTKRAGLNISKLFRVKRGTPKTGFGRRVMRKGVVNFVKEMRRQDHPPFPQLFLLKEYLFVTCEY